MVSVPDVSVARLAGAHGSGDGLGTTAVLGEAAGEATVDGAAADGAATDGAGVGVAAPEQAATKAPASASVAAKRNGVLIVRRLSSMSGPARVYPLSRPHRWPSRSVGLPGSDARLDSGRARPGLRDAAPRGG